MLEQVFLKGGFSGFGATGLDPILQLLPVLVFITVSLVIVSMLDSALDATDLKIRFWKKKKRSYSSSESS